MKHLLKLLLIAAVLFPLGMTAQGIIQIDGDKVLDAKDNKALNIPIMKMRDAKPVQVVPNRAPVPDGYARITLVVGVGWYNSNTGAEFGYQMLLDQDASIYNNTLAGYATISGGNNRLSAGSDAAITLYNNCEYKIPEDADPTANTQNFLRLDQATIEIPAGTYDYAITINEGNYIYFASDRGDALGRANDFVFKSGSSYMFFISGDVINYTAYDAVDLVDITTPYMATFTGDGAFGNVQIGEAATAAITVMNIGDKPFTPVVNCDNPTFTITSTDTGLLASGASRNYVVTFAPTELKDYNGTFTLTAEEQEALAYDIRYSTPLSGTGVGEGHQGDPSGGGSQDSMFPIYTNNFRFGTSSQMIYPASMLAAQGIKTNDVINSLTFYVRNNGTVNTNIRRPNVTLSLGKTTATTVTSQNAMETNRGTCTQVFSGNLTGGQNTLTVTLTTPYVYQGGNLIVDFVTGEAGNYNFNCNWDGEDDHTNASYCTYVTRSGSYYYTYTTNPVQGNFLPKMSIAYTSIPDLEATTSLDFGTVRVGNGVAKVAIVKNEIAQEVQATITVSPNPPFSVANSTVTIAANSFAIIPVTFMPNDEGNFSGTMTVGSTTISLTGVGKYMGPEAVKDSTFFKDITYTWPIVDSNGMTANSQTSKLNEIATDPDQIIAMLREVYMNKTIPGNYYRGFNRTGGEDHDYAVSYAGVGTIASSSATTSTDSYGWNIPGNVLGSSYKYLDPEQYKPNEEGVTLLLIEMQDDFDKSKLNITAATHNYSQLRTYINAAIRTARVVTEARRVGKGTERGTMFKIDCDKMNKFYLLAKGQLLWFENMNDNITISDPVYYSNTYTDQGLEFSFLNGPALLCHMFEQFSPSISDAQEATADLYWDLVDMEPFPVIHDCPNVPYVQNGHHFMMYGSDSQSADCQDIRDLMFTVPDYRMLEHINRGSTPVSSATRHEDYFRYHTKHQPTMGLFVIHQDEIPEIKDENIVRTNTDSANPQDWTGLCKHQLAWESNLDDFLPGEYQYYELWEKVVDEFGMEKYVNVYYRNENGEYQLNNGTWVSDTTGLSESLKPVILPRELLTPGAEGFTYPDVYVDMMAGSQIKTYVVRGRDSDGFLSLQMSNPEEVFIPGLDPNEKAHMIGATYYSRYNPANEMNCYSNRLELSNNGMTLTAADVNGKEIKFYRSSRAAVVDANGDLVLDANGNIQYAAEADKVLVATATANGSAITVTLNEVANVSSEFPVGKSDGNVAGYHANGTLSFPYTIEDGVINLTNGFRFWDNFTVKVDKNAHPLQYLYRMEVGEAYSNNVRVPVFKTDSKINSSFTKDEVDNDGYQLVDGALVSTNVPSVEVVEDIEFEEKVQLSSKTEILRYDAYRWNSADTPYYIVNEVDGEDEGDLPPDGLAGNAGDYYTVTMNDVDDAANYYVAPSSAQPQVSTANPTNWAKFVDYYPKNNASAVDYLYAPVVELFSRGYLEQPDAQGNKVARRDYNTYGGPQQNAATGKFEFIEDKDISYSISDYSWPGARDLPQYSYYNVFLNFSSAEIPAGYKLYMVRAWRQAPADMLGEQTPNESDATADYRYRTGTSIGNGMNSFMFDEIKYDNNEYCNVASGGTNTQNSKNITQYKFGDQLTNTEIPNVWNYTFGARRVSGLAGEEGWNTVDEVPLKFIVRAYFTKEDNINGSKADADGKFYITEKTIEYKITGNGNIVTAVSDVKINKQVVGVTYYNTTGMSSKEPFDGINIVVTHYNDGTTSTTKVLK